MAQVSVGKLLPNLKVTMDNEEIECEPEEVTDVSVSSKIEIVRPNIGNLQNPKLYINRNGGFATGIDLIEQETSGILSKRAERFGLDMEKMKPSISSLYESMGIDVKNRDSGKMKHIRFDAIHVRGVHELSTDEVFMYFQDYGPSSIEWINDCSCNVLWFDENSCARALLGLSKPLPPSFPIEILGKKETAEHPDLSSLKLNEKEKDEMEVDDDSTSDSQVDIPVPPGLWRLGVPHSRAKTILLRFATKGDKKLPGAEKRSNFYRKYGNPNYAGLKGYISSSRKHKAQVSANRWAIEKGSKSLISSHHSDSSVSKIPRQKLVRMRMYADDEEMKTKKLRLKDTSRKGSVHSRLGVKYTSEDLCQLGAYQDYDRNANEFESDNYEYMEPTLDLRSKLKRQRSNSVSNLKYAERYNRNISRKSDRSSTYMKYRRVDDLKKESRSFYKRKHRSPLCQDDDDDDDEDDDDDSNSD